MQLLTLDEVADRLKCSRRTVERLIDQGQLAVVPLGTRAIRVSEDDVDTFITSGKRLGR